MQKFCRNKENIIVIFKGAGDYRTKKIQKIVINTVNV